MKSMGINHQESLQVASYQRRKRTFGIMQDRLRESLLKSSLGLKCF